MRTLIWDFDGTLGYREGGMFGAALLEVVQRAAPDLEISQDQIRPYLQSGFPWHTPERAHVEIASSEQWWERIYPVFERALGGIGFDSSEARSMAREARAIYTDPERWCLLDDVIPTLEELTSCGWQHVILSNHVPELDGIVRHLGLRPYLARIFNSAKTGYEKPHPRSFQIAMESFPDSEQFWMMGDSMRADVAGAEAVGIAAILVRRPHPDAQRYCESLHQLPAILRCE
jgi:putative hydrolase of the HAD superfamily